MSDDSDSRGYTVGYGRPPAAGQFKPGTSGNPKGRPKGKKTIEKMIRDALEQTMTVKVNGKPKRMPCGQIGIERVIFDFAKGDPKARILVLAMLRQFPGAVGGQADSSPDASVSEIDAKAMADYFRRLGIKL